MTSMAAKAAKGIPRTLAGSTPAGPHTCTQKYGDKERGMDMAKKTTAAAAPPKAYASAMDKLRDEMAENAGNRYVQVVGEYLTDYLLDHPEAEAAILAEGKSIKGSLSAMEAEARKVKVGSVAVLDDETGFRIVRGYFGIVEAEGNTSSDPAEPGHLTLAGSLRPTAPQQGQAFGETTPDPVDPFDRDALLGVM